MYMYHPSGFSKEEERKQREKAKLQRIFETTKVHIII